MGSPLIAGGTDFIQRKSYDQEGRSNCEKSKTEKQPTRMTNNKRVSLLGGRGRGGGGGGGMDQDSNWQGGFGKGGRKGEVQNVQEEQRGVVSEKQKKDVRIGSFENKGRGQRARGGGLAAEGPMGMEEGWSLIRAESLHPRQINYDQQRKKKARNGVISTGRLQADSYTSQKVQFTGKIMDRYKKG